MATLPSQAETYASVVIPSYNKWNTLRLTLESLTGQDTYPFEVVIADSGSTDGTLTEVEKFKDRLNLKVIRGKFSGRSGARNAGILEASSPIIIFLDADMITTPDFIKKHVSFHLRFNRNQNKALLGLEVRVNDEEELKVAQGDLNRFLKENPERASIKRSGDNPRKLPWYRTITGNLSLPRATLFKAGLFDLSFQGYGYEDIELGYRLHKLGVTLYHLQIPTFHLHPYTVEQRVETSKLAGRNLAKFFLKHGDKRIPLLLGINPFNKALKVLLGKAFDKWYKRAKTEQATALRGLPALIEDLYTQISKLESYEEYLRQYLL